MKFSRQRIAPVLALAISVGRVPLLLAANPRIDVSQIIPKTEAESILGEKVTDPTPRNARGKDGYYSKCNYYSISRRKSLLIRVYQASADAISPAQQLESVAANSTAEMRPIDGLGDKAQMVSGAGTSGSSARALMLYVVKGDAFLTIGVSGVEDENVALEKVKEIANKILAKL
jgi:hypothetical protein